ncbi:MAG: hypothetical protein MUE73_01195, partial [Planctomycetes bacterium]|nr:hypothetical protein [Planctomycetota bacterium]
MGPRRLLPAILLLLLPGPALLAGDDRVVKVEVSLAGRGGRSLAPLVIHLAPWQAEHAKVEEEVERFLALEARALGGLIEHDASVFGLDSIVSLDITWTPRGQLYDQYRDLAGRLDERLGRLRTIEGEYFAAVANLLPDGPPAVLADGRRIDRMDAPLRDRVIAALRQRLADAFAAREAAVDSHLEATVRAESSGVPGNATLARGIQGTLALEAGGHLLSEIEAKEKERISLVAAIEQTERDLEKKSKEAVELGQAPPADPAEHERKLRALSDDIASLRAKLDGRPAGPDGAAGEKGQKPRLRETEGAISELRQRYAEARQRRLAEAAVGGEGGAATGNAMARISSHYVELEHARRTMARTTADLEILAESLTTIGAGRVERAIAARRLAVADPDVAERILHDRDLPAREVIMSSGAELREAAIDTGIASLLRRGAGTEDALLAQNEYLHGLSTLLGKKQLAAGSGGTRALQWVSNLGRGVLDLGFGAWDGFLDNTKQVVNRASPYPFRTKTARTRDSLADERKKTRDKIQILEQARGRDGPALFSGFDLSPDEPFDLGGDSVRRGAGAKAAPLDLLKRDRAFFDATNGGLRRIACSFDVTLFERLRSEYLVACERAALTLEGLERAQARHHNMDEDTRRFSPKAILSPGRVAETLCYIYLSRGKADDLNSHVALRTEQLGVMKGLLPLWKRLDFDVLGLTRWEHFGEYRQTIRNHAELLRHPDYARFWEVAGAEREAAQEDLSRVLAEEAARTNTVDRRDHAARERVRQAIPRTAGLLAGALVEDAKDLGFQDDFAGCYAALARANAMDWSVVSTETLRRVEDELAWLEASDLATTSLIQVADQAFYAALSARMFPPGPQTPLGTLVRHPSLIYKAAKATIGTWKGLSGLAGFAVQQVNPLSMILNWNTLVRGELAVGLVSLARATSEALTREALRDGVFCRVMDPEWADALANILVDAAFFKAQQSLQDHFVTKWANELKDAERQLERTRRYQDIAEHTEVEYIRRQARAEMMSAVELSALEARVRQVRGRLQFFQGAGLVTDEKRAERLLHQAARAEHQVQAIRHPTTARRVDNVLTALAWGLDSDDPEVARKARVELFRRLDVD